MNDMNIQVPSDEAIFQVSGLIADQGTGVILTFLGYPIVDLALFWTAFFDGGAERQTQIMPHNLSLAMTACKYYDETLPVVTYHADIGTYQIERRVA